MIKIIDLGLKDYQDTLNFQYECIEKRISNKIEDTIIFVEHPHTITMGKKSHQENILDKSLPIYQVERGGDVTYHGIGQLVGYPIIDINDKKDIGKFLRSIEEVLILVLKDYGLNAERKEKHTGVWISNGKKIVSVGVSFKNWVSYHGFALNVSTDLSYFYKINPCGLDSSVMTSMEKELGLKIDFKDLKKNIVEKFNKVFY